MSVGEDVCDERIFGLRALELKSQFCASREKSSSAMLAIVVAGSTGKSAS